MRRLVNPRLVEISLRRSEAVRQPQVLVLRLYIIDDYIELVFLYLLHIYVVIPLWENGRGSFGRSVNLVPTTVVPAYARRVTSIRIV